MQKSHCTTAFTETSPNELSSNNGLYDCMTWLQSRRKLLSFFPPHKVFKPKESQIDPSTSNRLVSSPEIRLQKVCHCLLLTNVGVSHLQRTRYHLETQIEQLSHSTQEQGLRHKPSVPSFLGFLSKINMEFLHKQCKCSHLHQNWCTPTVYTAHQEKAVWALFWVT